jgi:hypothetical protein
MATTHEIEAGRRIDLAREVVGLGRSDRRARLVEQTGGPPQRIDGLTVGAPELTGDAPHDGEMHPDGDELLYLISGAVTLTLELADGDRLVDLARATRWSCRRACGTRSPCGNQDGSSTSPLDRTATPAHSPAPPEIRRPPRSSIAPGSHRSRASGRPPCS